MASVTSRRRLDTGRIVMVPAAVAMLVVDVRAQLAAVAAAGSVGELLRGIGAVLACAFYALIIWSYLRRGPAVATTNSVTASAIAVTATFTPFAFPLLAGQAPGSVRQLAADTLLVAGTTWSVWSLR